MCLFSFFVLLGVVFILVLGGVDGAVEGFRCPAVEGGRKGGRMNEEAWFCRSG